MGIVKDSCETQPLFKKCIEHIRLERNKKLQSTDYLMIQDVFSKYDVEKQQKITEYRQKLRDFMNDMMEDKIPFNINLTPEEILDNTITPLDAF
tara:strand:+ start:232 stop:513 length:282 start_codon:yes stop_codon:yes gene_type:complete